MSDRITRTANDSRNARPNMPGPYLARVVGHLDPTYMGALKVKILRERGNAPGEDSITHIVRPAFPFFGYTGYEFMGNNDASSSTADAFNDTQKSYGMWFVPPDVGVVVLIMFVEGNAAHGYWMGCVPSNFTNHMVPAIGASSQVDMDAQDRERFDTANPLPVAEINRRRNAVAEPEPQIDPSLIKKPLHPIAEKYLQQGLLEDEIRGSTTTTSRRNLPSSVYGISTPGPRDKRPGAKKGTIGSIDSQTTSFISRLGGTQFVMDDGDERFERKAPAGELGFDDAYASLLNGEKGDPEIPFNEYVRLRTRTGHQLLMHNSEDIIYIGNARGTAWVELTSNGKIDIYANDSISIHTENDLNIRADRDINFEAGRNVNFRTGGRFKADVSGNFELTVDENSNIAVDGRYNLLVAKGTKITTSDGGFSLHTKGANRLTTESNTEILSEKLHKETAKKIHMNGPDAVEASKANPVERLALHENPASSKDAEWVDQRYQIDPITSIMKRVPMHEPWPNHENLIPQESTPEETDRENIDV